LHREDNLSRLEVLVTALIVSPFDEMAARRCSQIKAELEEQGELLDDLDLQIASIALIYDLPLATNNTKHFRRIKDLKIENWIQNTK
jgi:tRNA(fMet)-specific endonuclease VapC